MLLVTDRNYEKLKEEGSYSIIIIFLLSTGLLTWQEHWIDSLRPSVRRTHSLEVLLLGIFRFPVPFGGIGHGPSVMYL